MADKVSTRVAEKEIRLEAPVAREVSLPAPAAERLNSLDTFRGFIMFWIVGGEALMVGVQALGQNPIFSGIVYELKHTPWKGLRFYDCIWPSFMLMVGLSLPLSFAKRSLAQSYSQFVVHALRRSLVLFLLGSVRESVFLGSPFLIELSSALQPIAIAYFVAVLLVRKSPRVQAAVAALILAAYALLLALVPAPGIPAGTYELNHNLVNEIDLALFRAHWARWPYAPEGWGTALSTIPTVSTTILGLLIGELLMSKRSKESKVKMMGAAGLSCLALGYALSPVVPIVMKMWTTSYGLVTAGWACLMFLVFYWLIDVRGYRRFSVAFVAIGANAIFIYMFASLVPLGRWVGIFTKAMAGSSARVEPLTRAVCVLAIEWLILFWMCRKKLFIKA